MSAASVERARIAKSKKAAQLAERARAHVAICKELHLPLSATKLQIAKACVAAGERDDAWRAADRARDLAEREAVHGAVVEMPGREVRLIRRAALVPRDGSRIRSRAHLEAALSRARDCRIVGVRNTSSPITAGALRALAAPIFATDQRAA